MASTSTSTKATTQTVNGKTVTKTVFTETTVTPDGKKTVRTWEEIKERSDDTPQLAQATPIQAKTKPHQVKSTPTQVKSPAANQPAATTAKSPAELQGFIQDVAKAHNVYRKKHGQVGDLKVNPALNEIAQGWANHLASTGASVHSTNQYKGNSLGENLASKWGCSAVDYTGQDVTDSWYSEIKDFNFNDKKFASNTGHFTQVVWKGSKEIGVGKAFTPDGNEVFVCSNYYPAGNYEGEYDKNIFPA